MIFTDYYLLRELIELPSHRYDCIASTGNYPPFETIARHSKKGNFFCYLNELPPNFRMKPREPGKPQAALTNRRNITSLFTDGEENTPYAYGDVKDTRDALLLKYSTGKKQIEVFIARGEKNNGQNIFALAIEGELDTDMQAIRQQAKPTQAQTE